MFSVYSRDMRVFTGANSVSANTIHMWMSTITTSRSLWAAVSSYCAHLLIYSEYCLLFLQSRRRVVTDLPADGSTGSRPLMCLLISKVRNTPFVSSWFCIHSLLWWSSFSSSEVVFPTLLCSIVSRWNVGATWMSKQFDFYFLDPSV